MTEQVFLDGKITLKGGDCLEVLKSLPDNSVHSCVTDPPYHLTSITKRFGGANATPAKHGTDGLYARASKGFMQATWDGGDIAFRPELWFEVWRVLKPGGYLAAFSATRTVHRMACAIEDAGFEIRDDILNMIESDVPASRFFDSLNAEQRAALVACLDDTSFTGLAAWVYGSGFPKSHDVSKGIDKAAGARGHDSVGFNVAGKLSGLGTIQRQELRSDHPEYVKPVGVTPEARQWQGWGTALKPAWEPIVLARKPLLGTVAANVLEHGTGALNIDATRVGDSGGTATVTGDRHNTTVHAYGDGLGAQGGSIAQIDAGRWPANIIHDGSDEVVGCFPEAGGGFGKRGGNPDSTSYGFAEGTMQTVGFGDSGSAARFFYSAKADKQDRIGSKHPTVKPVDLMQWLCRLVTPPGGTVLDPFAGSGSTGEAAWREGFQCVLIEREPEYQADIAERLRLADKGPLERRQRAIKQAPDAGPLFGANDNAHPTGRGPQDLRTLRRSGRTIGPIGLKH